MKAKDHHTVQLFLNVTALRITSGALKEKTLPGHATVFKKIPR